MIRTTLLLLAGLSLYGAPTASVPYWNQVQAVLEIRGASGTCTIKLSETPPGTYTPLHPDVDGTEYPGASTDTGRADTFVRLSDGVEVVTLGHQDHDRALAAATTYYWQISGAGCGGTVAGSFTTPTVGNGSNQQWPVPFDANQPWNYGYPQVDLLHPTWVVDPMTGVKLRPLNSALDRTWRTGGGANPPVAGFTAFQNFSGGTGWSNPVNILNNSTSTASTANTNPIDVYGMYDRLFFNINADGAYNGLSFDDLGAVIWASTSGTKAAQICIFTSPVAGCPGAPITVTPTGSFAKVASGSTDPDGAWPSNFPTPFFSGWGLTAPLGPDHVNTQGGPSSFPASGITCTSGVCTITAPSFQHFFPSTMVTGQRIFIAGSSPTCTNNLCTMATYQNAGQITLSETGLSISNAQWNVYMWGLRITPTAGTGTLTIGAAFKHAGSLGIGQAQAVTYVFNQHSVTTGDGHFGYLVSTPDYTNMTGHNAIYFVSIDGTVRSLYNNIAWTSSTCYTYTTAADLPSSILSGQFIGQPFPDATDPKTFYLYATTGSGSSSLFKIVYSGDLTEDLNTAYSYAQSGAGQQIGGTPCGFWHATNLTPSSLSLDIPSQIVANWSATFDTTIYPNLGSSWNLFAMSPGYAEFINFYGGGQNGPAWIALMDLSTGLISNLINTANGVGTSGYYGGMRFCGLHATIGSNTQQMFQWGCDAAVQVSPQLLGGPFEVTPIGLLEADTVTYDTNTCLDWPIGSGTGCPHRGSVPAYTACPAGNQFEFMGATGSNCLTFKFPTGGACNIAPNALEQSKFPVCPWNASYTAPIPLVPGDMFVDWTNTGCNGGASIFSFLCEQFRIISVTTISGGLQVVVQRNAMYDYCSFNPTNFPGTTINNGVASAAQMQHPNGFLATMSSGRLSGCYESVYVFNKGTNAIVGESSLLSGHGEIIPGSVPGSGRYSIIVGTAIRADKTLNNTFQTGLFGYPTTSLSLVGPTFQSQNGGIGAIEQSYVDSVGGMPWEVDVNSLNPGAGVGPEQNANSIGSITMTALGGGHPDVYTLTPILNGGTLSKVWYKTFPMLGWAGRYLLRDVSGPGCNIDASPWTMAYIYTAGECYAGSTANTVVVHVAGAWNPSQCLTGQSFLLAPCVVMGAPGAGGARQQRIYAADTSGQGSRLLSYLLTAPGEHYPYTHMITSPDSTFAVAAAHHTQGWTTMAWVLKLPPWQEDSSTRTKFGGIDVQIPSGPQYAEIQFGYSRYIGANRAPSSNLFCTSRSEACNTSGTPYNFESDTRTLTTCTTGCRITIPGVAPNLVYYRVRRSSDGVTWTNQDMKAITIF